MISPIKSSNSFNCKRDILKIIPEGSVVSTFLFFDGELDLWLAEAERFVSAHTNKYVIYEFWKCVEESPERLIETTKFIQERTQDSPDMLYLLQESWATHKNPYIRSALFFLLNTYSSLNLVSSGRLNMDKFNPISLHRLKRIRMDKNFHLTLCNTEDFLESFEERTKESDFAIIPAGKFAYNFFKEHQEQAHETTMIDHDHLYNTIRKSQKKIIVLYKFHPHIVKLYKDFAIRYYDSQGNPTNNSKEAKEILIANFGIR